MSRFLHAVCEGGVQKFYHIFVVVMSVLFDLSGFCAYLGQRFCVGSCETIVQPFVIFGVTFECEKVCHWLLVKVGVAKEVEKIAHLLLDEVHLLFGVSLSIHVELPSGRLKNVSLRSFRSHRHYFINSSLNVCAVNVFHAQHELKKPWIRLLGSENKILVANNVNWIELLDSAVVNHYFVKTFDHRHVGFDPPVPPLGVLDLILKLWLDSVVHSIAKACIRR